MMYNVRRTKMSKQITILLTDEATSIVEKYMDLKKCTRNKAVNDLIVMKKTTTEEKMFKDILKKLDEIKEVFTKGSEE